MNELDALDQMIGDLVERNGIGSGKVDPFGFPSFFFCLVLFQTGIEIIDYTAGGRDKLQIRIHLVDHVREEIIVGAAQDQSIDAFSINGPT